MEPRNPIGDTDTELAFKDLAGKGIEDPRSRIIEFNSHKSGIWFSSETIDYKATYHQQIEEHSLTIGVAEQCGARSSQEDRLAVGSVREFPRLACEQRQDVMKNTCDFFQALVKQKKIGIVAGKKECHGGSTLISVVTAGQQFTLANLGDSVAYLLLLPHEGESTIQQLNTFHNPLQEAEAARLKKEGKEVTWNGKIGHATEIGTLAMSRAMGDNDFVPYGLSHEPEIKTIPLNTPPQTKAFIIVACDGLKDNLDEEEIKELVRTHRQQPLEDIAQALTQAACKKGKTGDNVSVVIMPVDRNAPYASLQAVFDGHGGDAVSDVLGQLYTLVLQHQTYLAVWKNLNPQISEASAQAVQECIAGQSDIEAIKQFLQQQNNEFARIFRDEFFKLMIREDLFTELQQTNPNVVQQMGARINDYFHYAKDIPAISQLARCFNEYLLPAMIERETTLQSLDSAASVSPREEFVIGIEFIEKRIASAYQVAKAIEIMKLTHCPHSQQAFLNIPLQLMTSAFEQSLATATDLLKAGQNLVAFEKRWSTLFEYQRSLQDLYRVAGITLAIREKYSKKMTAVDKEKVFTMDSKIERMIDRIEHTVETTFKALQESPDVAIEKQIEDMLTKLKELLPHVEKSSKVFGLFGDTEKVLTSLLAQACVEIEKVHHKLLSPKRRAP